MTRFHAIKDRGRDLGDLWREQKHMLLLTRAWLTCSLRGHPDFVTMMHDDKLVRACCRCGKEE